jgi:thiol-disulfide isomerase/thioredoxin
MRTLLALALASGLLGQASSPAQDPKKPEPTLKIGDKAPALAVTKWLQGSDFKSFEKDKVYVIEFWATWCVPCIRMMPHMSLLQEEYKEKGVTFVAFTSKDDKGNNLESVSKFVEKRGPKLKYAFAYADDSTTDNAWMKASGRSGIPCCFVVGKDGTLAFAGHPMVVDEVLPKVIAGTWTKEDAAGMEKVETEITKLAEALEGEPEPALKLLTEFETKHPKLADIPFLIDPKLAAQLMAKRYAAAGQFAEHVIAKAVQSSDLKSLQDVSLRLRTPDAGGDKTLLALSVKAAEGMVKVAGEKDLIALVFLAEAHFGAGDKTRAKEFGGKALAAAVTDDQKAKVMELIKKYDK